METEITETSAKPSQPKATRTRRQHTRSRAGCITCRKRHVKCDEGRPICENCKSGPRECEYAQSVLALRDRRAQEKGLPGAQEVWSIKAQGGSQSPSSNDDSSGHSTDQSPPEWTWRNLVSGNGPDPFDTLGIPMQYKSRELLQYFYHTADAFGVAPKHADDDCIAFVMHDPAALRNTLLLAGMHYSWNVGKLSLFEQTHIAAKIDAIQSINEWIQKGRHSVYTDSVRQVATLCLVECCTGNVARGEGHLNGLVTMLEVGQSTRYWGTTLDKELVDRYFILVANFLHGFKSRMTDVISNNEFFHYDPASATDEDVVEMVHTSHKRELDGLETRLKAIRLFPHFLAPPHPGTEVKEIECERYLMCLDNITRMELRRRAARRVGEYDATWNVLWMEGGPTRLFHCFVDSHVRSFSREPKGSPPVHTAPGVPKLRSSWLGLATAAGLYLNGVLDLFNAGEPVGAKLLVQELIILLRDIDASRPAGEKQACGRAGDLWVWKVTCAVFTLRKQLLDDGDGNSDGSILALEYMWSRLVECIQHWSQLSGVSRWEDAKEVLQRIVWLQDSKSDEIGREIWDGSVTSSPAS